VSGWTKCCNTPPRRGGGRHLLQGEGFLRAHVFGDEFAVAPPLGDDQFLVGVGGIVEPARAKEEEAKGEARGGGGGGVCTYGASLTTSTCT
jgi:hypothetical protein